MTTTGIEVRSLLTQEGPHSFAAQQYARGFGCAVCDTYTGEPPRADLDGTWVHPTCAGDPPQPP